MAPWLARRYEWVVTACCFLALFVNVGCVSTSFGVYQPYLAQPDVLGDVGASAVLTLRTAVSLAALFVVDRLLALVDVRVAMALSCALSGVGFVCYGLASAPAAYALGAVFAGLGNGLGSMVCVTVLLNRWFAGNVASAIGVATVGSGVAGVVVPVAATALVENASLGAAFVAEGVSALLVAAVTFALVQNYPHDMGRGPQAESPAATGAPAARHGLPAGRTLSRRGEAGLYGAVFLYGAVSVGGMAYLAILMTSKGFDAAFAAGAMSAGAVCLICSKVATGWAFDRFGGLRTTVAASSLLVAGLALLCAADPRLPGVALAGSVLYCAGLSLGSVGISVWSIDFSNAQRRTRTVKGLQVACMAGGMLFNLLPGVLKEATGGYVVSYAVMLVGVVAAAAVVSRAYAWRARVLAAEKEA